MFSAALLLRLVIAALSLVPRRGPGTAKFLGKFATLGPFAGTDWGDSPYVGPPKPAVKHPFISPYPVCHATNKTGVVAADSNATCTFEDYTSYNTNATHNYLAADYFTYRQPHTMIDRLDILNFVSDDSASASGTPIKPFKSSRTTRYTPLVAKFIPRNIHLPQHVFGDGVWNNVKWAVQAPLGIIYLPRYALSDYVWNNVNGATLTDSRLRELPFSLTETCPVYEVKRSRWIPRSNRLKCFSLFLLLILAYIVSKIGKRLGVSSSAIWLDSNGAIFIRYGRRTVAIKLGFSIYDSEEHPSTPNTSVADTDVSPPAAPEESPCLRLVPSSTVIGCDPPKSTALARSNRRISSPVFESNMGIVFKIVQSNTQLWSTVTWSNPRFLSTVACSIARVPSTITRFDPRILSAFAHLDPVVFNMIAHSTPRLQSYSSSGYLISIDSGVTDISDSLNGTSAAVILYDPRTHLPTITRVGRDPMSAIIIIFCLWLRALTSPRSSGPSLERRQESPTTANPRDLGSDEFVTCPDASISDTSDDLDGLSTEVVLYDQSPTPSSQVDRESSTAVVLYDPQMHSATPADSKPDHEPSSAAVRRDLPTPSMYSLSPASSSLHSLESDVTSNVSTASLVTVNSTSSERDRCASPDINLGLTAACTPGLLRFDSDTSGPLSSSENVSVLAVDDNDKASAVLSPSSRVAIASKTCSLIPISNKGCLELGRKISDVFKVSHSGDATDAAGPLNGADRRTTMEDENTECSAGHAAAPVADSPIDDASVNPESEDPVLSPRPYKKKRPRGCRNRGRGGRGKKNPPVSASAPSEASTELPVAPLADLGF